MRSSESLTLSFLCHPEFSQSIRLRMNWWSRRTLYAEQILGSVGRES